MYRYFTDLDLRWAMQGGLKILLIQSNWHESFPLLPIRHAGTRLPRRDSMQTELRRNMRIKLNREVPQTNRRQLGCIGHGWFLLTLTLPMLLIVPLISGFEQRSSSGVAWLKPSLITKNQIIKTECDIGVTSGQKPSTKIIYIVLQTSVALF